MGNRYRLVRFLIVLAGSVVASNGPALGLTLEDFEGYVDTAGLVAAWVPSATGTETLEGATVFEGQKTMRVDYDCSQGSFLTVFTYDVEQNWSSYSTFSMMYLGTPELSGEKLVVELRDPWGGFWKGTVVVNATQAADWMEYSMDISGWASREWVKEVEVSIEADSGGSGTIWFDYLLLPSAISVNANTWTRIKSMYASTR